MVYDRTGTTLIAGKIYGNQNNRDNVTIHDHGAYLMFVSNSGGQADGFEIEFQCYALTTYGKYIIRFKNIFAPTISQSMQLICFVT